MRFGLEFTIGSRHDREDSIRSDGPCNFLHNLGNGCASKHGADGSGGDARALSLKSHTAVKSRRSHTDDGARHGAVSKLSCREVLEQLWEYLDDDARAELRTQINEHVGSCRDCQVEVDSLRQVVRLYRADDCGPTPIVLSEKLRIALGVAYRERNAGSD